MKARKPMIEGEKGFGVKGESSKDLQRKYITED